MGRVRLNCEPFGGRFLSEESVRRLRKAPHESPACRVGGSSISSRWSHHTANRRGQAVLILDAESRGRQDWAFAGVSSSVRRLAWGAECGKCTLPDIRIAELGGAKWSNVARPDDFAAELAKVNTARDGRVVPVIKLAKAMTDCFITQEDRKISGYHMESLAIGAFTDYQGPLDPKAMLNRLFRHSTKAVMSPIIDSTGQSRCVDEYLGPADSGPRKQASTYLGQMRGKINSCKTRAEFNALFCIED